MANENTPLDAPNPSSPRSKPNRTLRVFQIIGWVMEGLFGLIVLLGLFFKLESWEGAEELLILGITCIGMYYMFALWAIAGSKNWLQGLATVPVGIALFLSLGSILFRMESWEAASELTIIGFLLLMIGLVTTILIMTIRYPKSGNQSYYWHILIRLLIVTLLTAPGFFGAF